MTNTIQSKARSLIAKWRKGEAPFVGHLSVGYGALVELVTSALETPNPTLSKREEVARLHEALLDAEKIDSVGCMVKCDDLRIALGAIAHPAEGRDIEAMAWAWLERKFGTGSADPVDRAYAADEMVDAFHAGRFATPAIPQPDTDDREKRSGFRCHNCMREFFGLDLAPHRCPECRCSSFSAFPGSSTTPTAQTASLTSPSVLAERFEQGELPITVTFAVAYLDGALEDEHPEILKHWLKVRAFVQALATSIASPGEG